MAYTVTAESPRPPAAVATPRIAMVQYALLWLIGAGGAIVFIEPSPYEFATLAATIFFFATGLRFRLTFVPLACLMILINLGYTIGAAGLMHDKRILNWIMTSWYMAVTVLFFALVFAENTSERLEALNRGLIAGALIASLTGIIGYFNIAGRDLFTLYGRASGTFKDPNVLSAFLVLPALLALQSIVTDPPRKAMRSAAIFGVICIAILLAFSRAAWGLTVLSSGLMLALMFVTSKTQAQRSRIVVISVAAVSIVAVMLVILLSFDQVQELFKQRASFEQSYDSGRYGRFGRHIIGAQMALDLPLGIGPLQFSKFLPEDTHNSYLNAFMSGGWLSGICYPALIFTTVILGFRHVFVPVPWQRAYLAVFATFVGTVGESFVIDTDHWRHFWMMLGVMWGLFAAAQLFMAQKRAAAISS